MTSHDETDIPGSRSPASKAAHGKSAPTSQCSTGPFEVKKESLRAATVSPRDQRRLDLASPRREVNGNSFSSAFDEDDDLDLSVPNLEPPLRQYDCRHYETCLDLAASLNWISFTCSGCVGQVNPALYWRAHQVQRKDSVARALCELRPLESVDGNRRDDALGDAAATSSSRGSDVSNPPAVNPTKIGTVQSRATVTPFGNKSSSLHSSVEVTRPTVPRVDLVIGVPTVETPIDDDVE